MAIVHTPDTVKAQMQADIAASNAKTGATDATLHDAVNRLIGGFGSGITPTGTKEITENGTYDVISFASAIVNVPNTGCANNYHILPWTTSGLGGTAAKNNLVISGNEFVKAHYADEAFFMMLIPLSVSQKDTTNYNTFLYSGNRAIADGKYTIYGVRIACANASTHAAVQTSTAKISGNGYQVSLRVNSSGDISIYTNADMYVPAGNYLFVMGLAE